MSASGWNCVPIANQSAMRLSIASTMPSGQRAVTSKPRRHFVDRHVVHAVDAQLAVAVHALHERAGRELQRVAMGRIERIVVRQRRRADPPECAAADCRPSSR